MSMGYESERSSLAGRIVGAIPPVLRMAFLVFLAFACICIGFLANIIEYSFYLTFVKENVPWLILASAVLGCACALAFWAVGRTRVGEALSRPRTFALLVAVGTCALIALQLVMASGMRFVYGEDSGVLSDVLAQGTHADYFSMHPHNLFCEGIFTLIGSAAGLIGADPYPWIVAGGCISVSLSVSLVALTTQRVAGGACGAAVFLIGAVWLGLSPMAQVPYTDSYGMLWPSLALFLYACVRDSRVKWPLIAAAAVFGYSMKAPSLAVVGAIVIVEACGFAKRTLAERAERRARAGAFDAKGGGAEASGASAAGAAASGASAQGRGRHVAAVIGLTACAFLLAAIAAQAIRLLPDVETDPERELGVTHYLMMGAGEDLGVYSSEDFAFSTSFATRDERASANVREWQRRVEELGPAGIASLALSKMMTVLGNGSFFWGGDVVQEVTGEDAGLLGFFGMQRQDSVQKVDAACPWNWFAQVIWGAVLLGGALCLFRRRPSNAETVICVALLLFCIYTLIFEANPRYPFMFAPLFLMLGALGWQACLERAMPRAAVSAGEGR